MNDQTSTDTRIDSAAGAKAVAPHVLEHRGVTRIDYVDHFAIHPVDASVATPQQWARAMFGDVPSAGERFIWRGILRLHLSEGHSPETVGGWRIAARGDSWIRLETQSKALSANLLVTAEDSTLSLTTLLRYERLRGRFIWQPLSAVHRMLVPGMLRAVTRKLAP